MLKEKSVAAGSMGWQPGSDDRGDKSFAVLCEITHLTEPGTNIKKVELDFWQHNVTSLMKNPVHIGTSELNWQFLSSSPLLCGSHARCVAENRVNAMGVI